MPTSDDYTGASTYWMIPTDELPLLEPIRGIPVVGTPLADLLEPDLKVIVNLGYGPDPDVGWSTTGANLPTPFGLFPSFTPEQFDTVLQALATGTQDGFTKAVSDLGSLDPTAAFPNLFDPSLPATVVQTALSTDPLAELTNIVNAFSAAASSGYSSLLGLADIANAVVTTIPTYDLSLFAQELTEGNLLNAVGMPIAADVGLGTLAAGFGAAVILNAITAINADFSNLF